MAKDLIQKTERDYGKMYISYNIKTNEFEITGNLNKIGQETILEEFLRSQIGAGVDKSEPNIRDIYNITLIWHPDFDNIKVFSDTGNKGLRDAILYNVLNKLN